MLLHLIRAHDKITNIDLLSLWIKTILCFYSLFECLVHCKVPVSYQNAVELAIITSDFIIVLYRTEVHVNSNKLLKIIFVYYLLYREMGDGLK